MNIDKLKSKILQLAIQGKLTEQKSTDTPVEIILERILEEKEKLIKEKKIKREEPLPEITKEDEPFKLPNGWRWCRLGEICNFKIGKTPKRSNIRYWNKGSIPWVSISDMNSGKVVYETKEKITELADIEVFKNTISPKGTLIMSFKLSIGKVSILGNDSYHNEAIISIFPYSKYSESIKTYLFKIIPCLDLLSDTKNAVKGSTLNSQSINNVLIPLSPLEEQQRIVAKVNELFAIIDELAENKEEMLKSISDTRNKVLQLAIQGKLVEQCEDDEPVEILLKRIAEEKEKLIKEKKIKKEKPLPEIPEEDKLFEIPDNWRLVRLGDISLKITDGSHNPPKGEDSVTEYLMLSSQNINTNGIINLEKSRFLSQNNYEVENKRTNVNKGDILLTIVGTIGRSCIYSEDLKITLQRSVGVIDTKYCNRYIKYLLDSPYIQNYFKENSSGTAQKGIYLNQLKKTVIPLPPLEEQQRIAAKIDEIMSYLDGLERVIVE